MKRGGNEDETRALWRLSAMGSELAFGIIGMVLLGLAIDYFLGTRPKAVITCMILGVIASVYNFLRQALVLLKQQAGPGGKPPKRVAKRTRRSMSTIPPTPTGDESDSIEGPHVVGGGAPSSGFAEVRGRVDVGPLLTLPLPAMLGAAVGAAAVVALIGWGVVVAIGPRNPGGMVLGVWLGGLAVAVAHGVGLVSMRPWRARRLGRWPFAWLIGRGVSFVSVLALAVLLYSAARPSPLPFGLVIASGYFAALMAEVAVYAAHVRSLPRPVSE